MSSLIFVSKGGAYPKEHLSCALVFISNIRLSLIGFEDK
jgi:hypothetical protein